MTARAKLRWVDVPRRSLREGLACGQGGVQILLMISEDSPSIVPSATSTSPCDAPAGTQSTEKPR